MPTKTREKNASAGKANALLKPLHPSEELAGHCQVEALQSEYGGGRTVVMPR
jgi:hypothetical protein